MSATETVQEGKDDNVNKQTNQLSLPERRSRASSLLQRLGEEREAPDPVGQYTIQVNESEIKDHRQVYLGVHIPFKPTRSRRSQYRKKSGKNDSKDKTANGTIGYQGPADRVRFILGSDDNDVERQIFSEMDELCCDATGEEEWKETARWLKFEEDVEEGGNRWSKPHVATLSLYSLFELRSCVLNGSVLLDLNANTMSQIADIVLDDLIATRQLDFALRPRVRDILLKKHKHLYERRKSTQKRRASLPSLRGNRKASVAASNFDKGGSDGNGGKNVTKSSTGTRLQDMDKSHSKVSKVPTAASLVGQNDAEPEETNTNEPDQEYAKYDTNFMKKIPPGAEGSMVLVGETDLLSKPMNAFVRLEDAVILGDMMEVPLPTRFLFFMLGPSGQPGRYHEVGRALATLMADEVFHDVAFKAACREDLAAGIDEFLQQVTVLPPGEWDPSIRIEPPATVPSQENRRAQQYTGDGDKQSKENGVGVKGSGNNGGGDDEGNDNDNELVRTGRFGGGLIMDIKRRVKCYKSDYVDALNSQCLASALFIYFALLAPIVTFGGAMESRTKSYMGAMEQLLAVSIGGLLFSLFSGQPLIILSATGPMLVFEGILYSFCENAELDYMPFRMWIGLWTSFFCVLLVVTDCSALVRYFTRFTEESFATLIGLIFIYEGGNKLYKLAKKYPVPNDKVVIQSCECMRKSTTYNNITNISTTEYYSTNKTIYDCDLENKEVIYGDGCGGAVFLLSTILTLGTFFLVIKLKSFKTSRFFPTKVRKVVSDFAVIISVIVMVGVDVALKVGTPKLNIPTEFRPTNPEARGWLITPLGKNPWWTLIAASIPALLTTILVFMDQQITAVIVNKREHKLKKGAGYHLDLAIVAIGIGVSSILGLPWVVAATVESLSHVRSLFVESTCTAPGERPKFFGVREQRLTGIFVFIMVGNTVFLGKFLKYIPLPVLYGLFIYMGVSALRGVQLFERIKILFMPLKHQPDRVYLRKVRISRIHIFTGIQCTCLVVLWVIKATPAAISFPLMVLALVAVRKVMGKIFTKHELEVLDDVMPESMKKKIEEADEMDEDEMKNEGEPVAKLVYNDSGINITEEVKNCTIWKSMESNQQNADRSDQPRERKNSKRKNKHKHKHKHKHHRHHGDVSGNDGKLLSVPNKPDMETLANEDDTDSQAIPLVILTADDENDPSGNGTMETTINPEDDGEQHDKDTKPLRPVSV